MNTKNNRGCLSAILGTLIVIFAVGAYAVLSSLISNAVISTRFERDAACALLSLSFTAISVSFVLYEVIFIVWEIKTSKSGDADAARLKKIFRIVCVACICLSLMLAVFSANTFTRLDGDSVSKVCFVEYKKKMRNLRLCPEGYKRLQLHGGKQYESKHCDPSPSRGP